MADSLIPTFVLDTDHPWLSEENCGWLESYPDVATALCDKSSPLWTSPSPGHEIPTDLFTRIRISNNEAGSNRLGWNNAVSRLNELRNCTAALEDVRYLYVNIFVHTDQGSDPLIDPEMPSELPGLFAEVLASMPSLEKLEWRLRTEDTVAFRDEFSRRDLTLPSVRHLVPDAQSHYLIPMCPSLETLEAGIDYYYTSWNKWYGESRGSKHDIVRAASAVNSIKELLIGDDWTPKKLEEVLEAMPNLVKLTIQGSLDPDRHLREDIGSEEDPEEKGKLLEASFNIVSPVETRYNLTLLQEYLSIISRFPKLEQLHLPGPAELGLGFDGGHWCGNAYDGEYGRHYGRTVVNERIDITELAGDMVMKAVPHLKILSIDDTQANLTRSEDGGLEIVWEWTGRKEEYAYEFFPQ
ncbi:hypothetical protein F4814DRAFT_452146 [Daldinia grandis]|nr:hypothetical protein F4814DRAFT_452146 [Daldinia grandis]